MIVVAMGSTGAIFLGAWRGRGRGCCGRWLEACRRRRCWRRRGSVVRLAVGLGRGGGGGKVGGFWVVEDRDWHIGVNKGANPDVTGTLKKAIDRANMAPAGMKAPDFMLHTGDITQNSKAAEFDTASEVIKGFKSEVFYVPGEHDFIDDGAQYKQRFGKGAMGNGWYSYNHKGVHFVGLNNCVQVDAMGNMGGNQLAWLKSDLAGISHSTPIVVFAHIP